MSERQPYDLVVYGSTVAAISAAIEATDSGLTVALVAPESRLGGMTASGLGWTDSKDGNAIGGLAREFYHRVWLHYAAQHSWPHAARDSYQVKAQPGPAIDDANQVAWTFEPHVAAAVLKNWLTEKSIPVFLEHPLDRAGGVQVFQGQIETISTLAGETFTAKVFIDATYEGDLMAAAGVSHRIGRDSNAEFGETLNGYLLGDESAGALSKQRYDNVDPFIARGDAASGLIAGIEGFASPSAACGLADHRLQSFNYRLCLTKNPDNRVAIECPADYDEREYELLFRLYEAGNAPGFAVTPLPNAKFDANNHQHMGLDFVGGNVTSDGRSYSAASYDERRELDLAHRRYIAGLIWTLQNHPRIPVAARKTWQPWGLAKDEFTDNAHWPWQLYVREARRMEGELMMTEQHVKQAPGVEIRDSIGLGSYSLDSHVVRRLVRDGRIHDEGGFYEFWRQPYPISYRAITPRRTEVTNLLVPVTLSATHAAFGSLRMEPTYFILGQSAGAAAKLAIESDLSVQAVPYAQLRQRLVERGQVLRPPAK